MVKEKLLPNGTEVFIFKYIREWGLNQDNENYIRGTIQNSKLTGDLSNHGSIWEKYFYTVLEKMEIPILEHMDLVQLEEAFSVHLRIIFSI